MKTKDIPELPILALLMASNYPLNTGEPSNQNACSIRPAFPEWANDKLIRSKMKSLIHRNLVTGCACGCRGDFEITSSGINKVIDSEKLRKDEE